MIIMDNTVEKYENTFTNIYEKNLWHMGQTESKSGLGSSNDYTLNIRFHLLNIIKKYNIKNMIDVSCGDLYWMKTILPLLNCNYLGLDIVKSLIDSHIATYKSNKDYSVDFKHTGFLEYLQTLPDKSVDLILCRHTCEHLHTDYVIKFISEAKRVSKYLLLTTHRNATKNTELYMTATPYRPINLNLPPYSDVLQPFQIDSLYDGPKSVVLSEMYINLYSFT